MFLELTEDNEIVNSQESESINNIAPTSKNYISKQQLISHLTKKLKDNPINNYNEYVREWSKGYRKACEELLSLLNKVI